MVPRTTPPRSAPQEAAEAGPDAPAVAGPLPNPLLQAYKRLLDMELDMSKPIPDDLPSGSVRAAALAAPFPASPSFASSHASRFLGESDRGPSEARAKLVRFVFDCQAGAGCKQCALLQCIWALSQNQPALSPCRGGGGRHRATYLKPI